MPTGPELDLEEYKRRLRGGKPLTPRQKYEALAMDPMRGPQMRAIELAIGPFLDVAGPQAPLTERLMGPDETAASRAVDAALKLSPLALGFGAGSVGTRAGGMLLKRFGGPAAGKLANILIDTLSGTTGGAVGGAASAAVQEEPVLPAAAAGGLLGGGLGAGLASISAAGRRLAQQWAARPGREAMPNIVDLDDAIPVVEPMQTVRAARASAARTAFRRLVPAGPGARSIKQSDPALWARATADARREAARIAPGARPDDLFEESDFLQKLSDRIFKIDSPTHRRGMLDSAKSLWGTWVTRLGTTLRRDPDFGRYGSQFGNMIARINQLAEHYEGQMRDRVIGPMWRGASKADELAVDKFLHGEGGPISTQGAAIARRWREIADDSFDQLSGQGVMQEVSETHPAAVASGSTTVPLQRRTNYVPTYQDHAAVAKLMKPGPAREAFLQGIIDRGEAQTRQEAEALFEQILANDRGRTPMHIRSGFQHERELTYGLPREKNARKWMERWTHDLSRRLATARVLGGKDEKLTELLKAMHKDGLHTGADRIKRLWQSYINRPPADVQRVLPIARGTRSLTAIQLLSPRTGLLQMMQLANPAARMGIKRTMEGIASVMRNPELRGAADEVGALLPTQHMLSGEEPLNKAAEWWLREVTRMPQGDRNARVLSALTAGVSAKQWAKEYFELATGAGVGSTARTGAGAALKYVGIRNPAERMQILRRRLEETLGVPVERVMAQRGDLGIDEVMTAMRSGSHNTQFGASYLDLPEGRRTATGQFLFQLKTFTKQQTTFFNKLVADAMKGDTGPLTRYFLTYPALYAMAKPALDFLSVKDAVDEADAETLERVKSLLHGALTTGMFGGMGDFISQMAASDPGRAAGYFLGPTIAQSIGLGQDVYQAAQGDIGPLAQRATPRFIRAMIRRAQEAQ